MTRCGRPRTAGGRPQGSSQARHIPDPCFAKIKTSVGRRRLVRLACSSCQRKSAHDRASRPAWLYGWLYTKPSRQGKPSPVTSQPVSNSRSSLSTGCAWPFRWWKIQHAKRRKFNHRLSTRSSPGSSTLSTACPDGCPPTCLQNVALGGFNLGRRGLQGCK